MSDGLPDCSTAYRSLGLGDYQTLATHYGSPLTVLPALTGSG